MSVLTFPQDAAGLLSLPANTESGTSSPFVINPGSAFQPANISASAATPAQNTSALSSITGAVADATGLTKLAQYTGLALLAVVLIAIGVFVLLKD